MSIKHAGFEEEREWRLIHLPFDGAGNAWVRERIVSVRGIPQLVYELPLDNIHPGMNISGLNLNRTLHRVIIGPSLYPETIRRAFVDKLRQHGVSKPEAKVSISETPLRQWG